ncbi:MAG: MarR family transcriptional regulator [Phycisphaerae bacterium]|jgi:DNA-binding MarR family transcriptional regulator
MSKTLHRQAERLYEVFAELVRRYQFRDRESTCCHGLSISQCYSLDAIYTRGPMTMGELAALLCLDLSTVTRIVDSVVVSGLASRATDESDRRVCRLRLTRKGRSLVTRIRSEIVKEHEGVLSQIPAESREAVITAMTHLLGAFAERPPQASLKGKRTNRRRQKAG